ncbi:ATP-binding response regulator [Solemya velum gill symbiont]|uniref:ATP-binding response regulator n=1 Tax=Solemya velum gill symbiont TaxID=2340 RepID=UPI0009971061|nr:hybrid sensor histidine kinase/response regulator [Solemya velum gill symbiont]OOY50331.1 hypothetical protein BOV97_11330 [Solemya velum gill symbiont]OOY54503.1 hypothetical protein BOV99_10760 [Solemya velum gill symbiont]OOY54981.1 hypothetical protein BOW00_10765 [Solemya velum gill symbiont]OOY59184.1 hypothetical protein BOW02_10770 [Solemya velum gill symbiont]OOY60538.1 hypothetical protein BOW04_10865 [Solemya velum gill symbiont]
MRLRTVILLTLLLFAVVPTLLFVAFSFPLMFDRMQSVYHQAHLQTLRADFRDLDEHLAGRREMTRVLAKLPEPGVVIGANSTDQARINDSRQRYTGWVNAVFGEQLDVVGISFIDRDEKKSFWLSRETSTSPFSQTQVQPDQPDSRLLQDAMEAGRSRVLVSPVYTSDDEQGRPHPRMHLVAPIHANDEKAVALVITTIDIGGLANAYRSTLWVDVKGRYIGATEQAGNNAFDDYVGLETLLTGNRISLWQDPDKGQIIWIPMFRSADGEPLWVGRVVGQSPFTDLLQNLLVRGLLINLPVLIGIWFVARRVTRSIDSIGNSLGQGVQRIVSDNSEVNFNWKRPIELKEVGENLSRLSVTHARNQRNLVSHTQELEESNRFKSEFLANVSHELKTPLNSILVLSKLLKESEELDSQKREQAAVINTAGRDLYRLIENILELSLLERMEQSPSLEETDLKQLILDTVELMRPQYEEKSLTLETRFDIASVPMIVTDNNKLKQILRNLLANALKFTEQGGVTISVNIDYSEVSHSQPVHISVQDTGMGIPAEEQKRIFEAFRQADGSIRRRFGGTGLGLNISQRLAHMIGGKISLDSKPGEGARFTISLPLEYSPLIAPDEETTPAVEEQAPAVVTEKMPDYQGKHVLIIDDDVDNLLQLSRILSQWNIEAIIASDDEEIREALVENPDCLLTLVNLKLCESNKCDSIHLIEEQSYQCTLVAIGDEEHIDMSSKRFEHVLTPPFDAEKLKELIDHKLQSMKTD